MSEVHIGDIAERVDNGRRLALVECGPQPRPLDRFDRIALERHRERQRQEPLPEDTIQRVAADVAEALDCLAGARRYLKIDGEKLGASELDAELALVGRDIENGLIPKLAALKERVS